jgi:primosomal protein N''
LDALETELQEQITQVRAALRQARAEQDEYLADIHQAELDGLNRTAAAHGLRVDGEPSVDEPIDLTAFDPTLEPGQARSA